MAKSIISYSWDFHFAFHSYSILLIVHSHQLFMMQLSPLHWYGTLARYFVLSL